MVYDEIFLSGKEKLEVVIVFLRGRILFMLCFDNFPFFPVYSPQVFVRITGDALPEKGNGNCGFPM